MSTDVAREPVKGSDNGEKEKDEEEMKERKKKTECRSYIGLREVAKRRLERERERKRKRDEESLAKRKKKIKGSRHKTRDIEIKGNSPGI